MSIRIYHQLDICNRVSEEDVLNFLGKLPNKQIWDGDILSPFLIKD